MTARQPIAERLVKAAVKAKLTGWRVVLRRRQDGTEEAELIFSGVEEMTATDAADAWLKQNGAG